MLGIQISALKKKSIDQEVEEDITSPDAANLEIIDGGVDDSDEFEDEESGGLEIGGKGEFENAPQEAERQDDENALEFADDELENDGLSLDTAGEFVKSSIRAPIKTTENNEDELIESETDTPPIPGAEIEASAEVSQNDKDDDEYDDDDDIGGATQVRQNILTDPMFTNKGDEYPQIHGNYFLLDHLVDGGMAKICRARYMGEGDQADKLTVIKMVQEKFSDDPDFVAMFIDEIKICFSLNHPNISATFDYGKIGKNLFVSMEYIHGKDLMILVDSLAEQGTTIPIPIAIYIAAKMCEGLHYAHNYLNPLTGKPYNIVHRDISPHNVMVSFEGFVKVIDFGIAKADTNSTEEAGTIKGKVNYFAPEYLEGKPIDHTYDQFAVGLTLWEMLTGKKTFTGEDQIKTMKSILVCNPEKASLHNKEISTDLDDIIMQSLSREPTDRFKDIQAFGEKLTRHLYVNFPDFHEDEIITLMAETYKEDLVKDKQTFLEWGKISIKEIADKIALLKATIAKSKENKKVSTDQGDEGTATSTSFDFGFEEEAVSVLEKSDFESEFALQVGGTSSQEKRNKAADERRKQMQMKLAEQLEGFDEDGELVKGRSNSFVTIIIFLALVAGAGFHYHELIFKTYYEYFPTLEMRELESNERQARLLAKEMAESKNLGIDNKGIDSLLNKLQNADANQRKAMAETDVTKVTRQVVEQSETNVAVKVPAAKAVEKLPPAKVVEKVPAAKAVEKLPPPKVVEKVPAAKAVEKLPPAKVMEKVPAAKAVEKLPPAKVVKITPVTKQESFIANVQPSLPEDVIESTGSYDETLENGKAVVAKARVETIPETKIIVQEQVQVQVQEQVQEQVQAQVQEQEQEQEQEQVQVQIQAQVQEQVKVEEVGIIAEEEIEVNNDAKDLAAAKAAEIASQRRMDKLKAEMKAKLSKVKKDDEEEAKREPASTGISDKVYNYLRNRWIVRFFLD